MDCKSYESQITIYQFDLKNIIQTYTFGNNDIAASFEYKGLKVSLENLFYKFENSAKNILKRGLRELKIA